MHGKEYYVPYKAKNQAKAQSYCESIGGRLFEPKSAQVNHDVANLAKLTIKESWIWIGIHEQTSSTGQFVYESDGKSISWNNWKIGQPNGVGAENCVGIQIIIDSYNWSDLNCDVISGFVCERGEYDIIIDCIVVTLYEKDLMS